MQRDIHDRLLGTYAGNCSNNYANPPNEAQIVLVLKRLQAQEVIGDLTVHGDLRGGSEFSGVVSGERITFVTRSPDKKATITWTGTIVGDVISGGYVVVDEHFFARLRGLRNQQGVWQCRKSDS